jgi:hypothetical protein
MQVGTGICKDINDLLNTSALDSACLRQFHSETVRFFVQILQAVLDFVTTLGPQVDLDTAGQRLQEVLHELRKSSVCIIRSGCSFPSSRFPIACLRC